MISSMTMNTKRRYAYCVNTQRVQRTLESTCICGSELGDYAKKKG